MGEIMEADLQRVKGEYDKRDQLADAGYTMPSERRHELEMIKRREALYEVIEAGDYALGDRLIEYSQKIKTNAGCLRDPLHEWFSYEDQFGMTVLHVAAGIGQAEGVTWLLKNGADVNQRSTQTNKTALDFALERREKKCAAIL